MMPRIKDQIKCDGCGTTECIPGTPYDVTIKCGNHLLPAHKDMLQKSSTYFEEYFSSIMAEGEVKTGFVHLKEIDGPTFEAILHFLYTSCICKMKSDLFGKVLEAARFLGIDDLYSYCWEEMNKKIDVDYFAELWTFAEAFEEESLTKIKCFVASKFVHASRTTDFFNLEGRHVETLLRHPQWHGSSDGALVAVVQWTKYDVKKRQQELQNVASCIDLNTVTNFNLGLLLADAVILRAMFHLELKNTILNLCSQRFVQTDQPEPMMGHSIVCFKRIYNSNGVFERIMFHLEEEMWGPTEIMPFVLHTGMAIASFRGCVYGFGGSVHHRTILKTVYQYNPTMNVIYSVANLKTPVYEAAVGTLNNQLYVVGGLRDTIHYKESLTVQRYDPVTRTTTVLSPLLRPSPEPSVVAIGNNLYAVGKLFLNLQRYDVALDQWSVIFCPNACDEVCSAVVWDKKLFIVCAENLDAIEVELFDPIKDEWVRDTIANEPFDVNELWCIHEGTSRTSMLVFHRGSNIKLYNPEVKVWSDVNVQRGLPGITRPDFTILI